MEQKKQQYIIDEKILEKAKDLFETRDINNIEVGITKGLCQIHEYLFCDLYNFAGKVRTQNITKGGFRFANSMFLDVILPVIEKCRKQLLRKSQLSM